VAFLDARRAEQLGPRATATVGLAQNRSRRRLFQLRCILGLQAGLLLSFGVLMSCQVGGRWGSTTGVNNFVFAGFGIPFGR